MSNYMKPGHRVRFTHPSDELCGNEGVILSFDGEYAVVDVNGITIRRNCSSLLDLDI